MKINWLSIALGFLLIILVWGFALGASWFLRFTPIGW
jgi:hypothetical protein